MHLRAGPAGEREDGDGAARTWREVTQLRSDGKVDGAGVVSARAE